MMLSVVFFMNKPIRRGCATEDLFFMNENSDQYPEVFFWPQDDMAYLHTQEYQGSPLLHIMYNISSYPSF